MNEVGIEIIKTKEVEKYLNINVSNSEVERNPDIVRLCSDVGMLEYVKPKTGHWVYTKKKRITDETDDGPVFFTDYRCSCSECGGDFGFTKMYDEYCKYCGAHMVDESEDKE